MQQPFVSDRFVIIQVNNKQYGLKGGGRYKQKGQTGFRKYKQARREEDWELDQDRYETKHIIRCAKSQAEEGLSIKQDNLFYVHK
ncbi:hypothetical protein FKM82_030704 [Ascaphus truei]